MEEELVRATLREMKERSLKFTMDDLARKLHVSKSSIYKVVKSKEDLVRLVMHWAMERFSQKSKEFLYGEGPVNRRLMAFCGLFFETFWYLPEGVNEDLMTHYRDIWQEWDTYRRGRLDDMIILLDEGVRKGEYRKVNLPVVRQCVFSAAEGLTDPLFLKENNMTGRDALEALEDIMLNGLKAKESPMDTGEDRK